MPKASGRYSERCENRRHAHKRKRVTESERDRRGTPPHKRRAEDGFLTMEQRRKARELHGTE